MAIVVKNGIVLIDYITLCRERGLAVLNSVVTAGKSRLRPVLMTTATTVLGMIPMAIGGGQGSEMWSPMAIARNRWFDDIYCFDIDFDSYSILCIRGNWYQEPVVVNSAVNVNWTFISRRIKITLLRNNRKEI